MTEDNNDSKIDVWESDLPVSDNVWYRLDPTKIKTIQDVVMLLDAINIKFNRTHPGFNAISHLLKEEK